MKLVKKFLMKYMISCQEATRLLSERQERVLSPIEYLAVSLRAAMCSATRSYKKQTDALRKTYRLADLATLRGREGVDTEITLPTDAAQRIKKSLNDPV